MSALPLGEPTDFSLSFASAFVAIKSMESPKDISARISLLLSLLYRRCIERNLPWQCEEERSARRGASEGRSPCRWGQVLPAIAAVTGARLVLKCGCASALEARIDWLRLHCQYAKDALVDTREQRMLDKPMQRFQSQRELANGHPTLRAQAALLQAHEVLWPVIVRPIDDPEVLAP